jgi:hypothetical protein
MHAEARHEEVGQKTQVRALYRIRCTETVSWEAVLEAEGDEHARDIVDAGGVDALAHRSPAGSMAIIKSRASS